MSPRPVRCITVLLLRLGIAGLFVVALAITLTRFALFGCQSCPSDPNANSRKIEGMIVNPPDPPANPQAK